MTEIIKFHHSDLVDALYYFEYFGPLYRRISWIKQDENAKELYRIIKEIKFTKLLTFLPWARNTAVLNNIEKPLKLALFIKENPPKGAFAKNWIEESEKMQDILTEIYNMFIKKVLSKELINSFEKNRQQIHDKYSKIISKIQEQSDKLPGLIWKRKNPIICLLFPLDGRLSHKLIYSDIAFIEASEIMINKDNMFLHEVIKLLNYTKPIGSWIKQDKKGIRAIAFELFTELQTLKMIEIMNKTKSDIKAIITGKLYSIWIPQIRPETTFDNFELERLLIKSYSNIGNYEFDPLFQIGEIYTELNIILLT